MGLDYEASVRIFWGILQISLIHFDYYNNCNELARIELPTFSYCGDHESANGGG